MLKRFGVSLEEDLLKEFDALLSRRGYHNRSEALRDLIREALIKEEWACGTKKTAAVVVIVYDHHQANLAQKLTGLQHKNYRQIIATLHSHLDEHNCLEVVILSGPANSLERLANEIISSRGVKFGQLIPISYTQLI